MPSQAHGGKAVARQPVLRTPLTEGGGGPCQGPIDSRPPTQINMSVRYAIAGIALKVFMWTEVLIGAFEG